MITTPESVAFERGIGPLLRLVLPEKAAEIASVEADPQLRERIEELATKNTEGELTPEELAEYSGYVRANKFVAIFQRRAREMLAKRP